MAAAVLKLKKIMKICHRNGLRNTVSGDVKEVDGKKTAPYGAKCNAFKYFFGSLKVPDTVEM